MFLHAASRAGFSVFAVVARSRTFVLPRPPLTLHRNKAHRVSLHKFPSNAIIFIGNLLKQKLTSLISFTICSNHQSESRPGPASLLVGLYGGRNHIFGKLCSRSNAVCPSFIHAACSWEGARFVLAFIAFTRSAAEAPSSDSP
jgi:hypothetical protein